MNTQLKPYYGSDLLGKPIGQPEASPRAEHNPAYVKTIQQSIRRLLNERSLQEIIAVAIPGSFARLEAKDRAQFVGREILCTFIDTEQPEHSMASLASWKDGMRSELVVSMADITSVVPPLQAKYAFDGIHTAQRLVMGRA